MTAREFIVQQLKNPQRDVTVLGMLPDGGWWHIHKDEELPEEYAVAIVFEEHFNRKFDTL